jgi:hypothetical protein
MQKFFHELNEDDRRIARKWRWASFSFYGSILAGMVLYAAFHGGPGADYASVDPASHGKIVTVSKH